MQQIYWRMPMPHHTSALVCFFKFAAYFQSTFSYKQVWRDISDIGTPI